MASCTPCFVFIFFQNQFINSPLPKWCCLWDVRTWTPSEPKCNVKSHVAVGQLRLVGVNYMVWGHTMLLANFRHFLAAWPLEPQAPLMNTKKSPTLYKKPPRSGAKCT